MSILDATRLSKAYADRTILADASLTLEAGERVGLVGRNGSGKSTLGRILAGIETPDSGEIARGRGTSVDYLAQEPSLPENESVRSVVLASLADWTRARERYDALTGALAETTGDVDALIREQAEAGETLERLGGWERMHEAD